MSMARRFPLVIVHNIFHKLNSCTPGFGFRWSASVSAWFPFHYSRFDDLLYLNLLCWWRHLRLCPLMSSSCTSYVLLPFHLFELHFVARSYYTVKILQWRVSFIVVKGISIFRTFKKTRVLREPVTQFHRYLQVLSRMYWHFEFLRAGLRTNFLSPIFEQTLSVSIGTRDPFCFLILGLLSILSTWWWPLQGVLGDAATNCVLSIWCLEFFIKSLSEAKGRAFSAWHLCIFWEIYSPHLLQILQGNSLISLAALSVLLDHFQGFADARSCHFHVLTWGLIWGHTKNRNPSSVTVL